MATNSHLVMKKTLLPSSPLVSDLIRYQLTFSGGTYWLPTTPLVIEQIGYLHILTKNLAT